MITAINEEIYLKEVMEEFETVSTDKISVVIPFLNNWNLTHSRLLELWKYVYVNEVILIDDASTEKKIGSSIAWWQKETNLPLVYMKNEKNLGFGGSMNIGIWNAKSDIVVLLSNDVVVTGDFGLEVRKVIEPGTLIGNTLYNWDTGWNTFQMPDGKRIFPYLGGYFLAAYRDSFIEMGGFDERYGKFDFEDVDLCTTAKYLGYELIPLNSKHLNHMSGFTVRKHYPNREKYTKENLDKFYNKWKKILYESSS